MRNLVAAVLLAAGVLIGVAAWQRWQDETTRADRTHRENRYREAFGLSANDDTPDRASSFAIGGIGAVLFVSGVIVVAAAQPSRGKTNV